VIEIIWHVRTAYLLQEFESHINMYILSCLPPFKIFWCLDYTGCIFSQC